MAEGTHVNFIRKITGKKTKKNIYRTCGTLESGEVLMASGIQTDATNISHRQGTVTKWSDLRIFEVCAQEPALQGGGGKSKIW